MDISKHLFHGIRDSKFRSDLTTLESILSHGYILTNKNMNELKIKNRQRINFQGEDAVSICFHPSNEDLYHQFFSLANTAINEEMAYKMFVQTESPSIILNPHILDVLKVRNSVSFQRMPDEIQIEENIPLSLMDAIGVWDRLNNQVKLINKVNEGYKLNSDELWEMVLFKLICEKDYTIKLKEFYYKFRNIKSLLNEYGYKVPIVNCYDGSDIISYNELDDRIDKTYTLLRKLEKEKIAR